MEFNLPDGKQINLPIAAAEAYFGSTLIYSPKPEKASHFKVQKYQISSVSQAGKKAGKSWDFVGYAAKRCRSLLCIRERQNHLPLIPVRGVWQGGSVYELGASDNG